MSLSVLVSLLGLLLILACFTDSATAGALNTLYINITVCDLMKECYANINVKFERLVFGDGFGDDTGIGWM